jgi:hypothetical protein
MGFFCKNLFLASQEKKMSEKENYPTVLCCPAEVFGVVNRYSEVWLIDETLRWNKTLLQTLL